MEISQMIDQTILRPDASRQDIEIFLKGVVQHEFYAAVVNPCWVEMAVATLAGRMKVCSVVGFPLGASSTQAKVFATTDLISKGCDEIDMVMNIGWFKEKDFRRVGEEIKRVSEACQGKVLKVIIEACLLSDEEKVAAAKIAKENGAYYVKTSTGFSIGGATVEDVRLLRSTVGKDFGVKASGGIRTYEQACSLVAAGASRLGTSHGVAIVEAAQDRSRS
ncbi:MAG: deoxyribose-phosphate aldolase [candidate division WOR-3 bacterium]|nr:MAG: deoxyribose-phosphate aldolase [candidate division WOR-3 bacterium]